MRRLFLVILLVLSTCVTRADHVAGGEITWRCLSNGKYVFFMTVYRDCSGIAFQFQDETIQVIGNPLPTNLSSFILKPDHNRQQNDNQGYLDIACNPTLGSSYSCANGDNGSIQAYYYQ